MLTDSHLTNMHQHHFCDNLPFASVTFPEIGELSFPQNVLLHLVTWQRCDHSELRTQFVSIIIVITK